MTSTVVKEQLTNTNNAQTTHKNNNGGLKEEEETKTKSQLIHDKMDGTKKP